MIGRHGGASWEQTRVALGEARPRACECGSRVGGRRSGARTHRCSGSHSGPDCCFPSRPRPRSARRTASASVGKIFSTYTHFVGGQEDVNSAMLKTTKVRPGLAVLQSVAAEERDRESSACDSCTACWSRLC